MIGRERAFSVRRASDISVAVLALAVVWLGLGGAALAGPIEVFGGIGVAASNPDKIVARYLYGGGGFFYSSDRGESFRFTCYATAQPNLRDSAVQTFSVLDDGSTCISTGDEIFCSDAQGCGYETSPELKGKWVSDFFVDPTDRDVVYLGTSTSMGKNGLYVREAGATTWKPYGTQLDGWFSRVHVVKTEAGKRFYVSAQETTSTTDPMTMMPTEQLKYLIRYSDDDAVTWTSHQFTETDGSFRLIAVDPTNVDRLVISTRRAASMAPDDLYFSSKRGEPGSWTKIGSVIELTGGVFTPDGAFWYGDNDQNTPGLYKVAKLGDAPVKLSDEYKVSCLFYDPSSDRLYVCNDWRLGTADRSSGELELLFDLKTTSALLECPGEAPIGEQCSAALRSPNFCDITHYPDAPICAEFGSGGIPGVAGSGGSGGAGGVAGAAGAAGSGAAGMSAAGTSGSTAGTSGSNAGASAPLTPPERSDGGCSCSASSASAGSGASSALTLVGLLLFEMARRRQRRMRLLGRRAS
jgi:MYXO-CTERM domain-containing protein